MKTILCFLPAIAASRFADTALEVRAELRLQQKAQKEDLALVTARFVKTDAENRFKLGGPPVGNYKLKAWLDSKTMLERSLKRKAWTTLHVEFI